LLLVVFHVLIILTIVAVHVDIASLKVYVKDIGAAMTLNTAVPDGERALTGEYLTFIVEKHTFVHGNVAASFVHIDAHGIAVYLTANKERPLCVKESDAPIATAIEMCVVGADPFATLERQSIDTTTEETAVVHCNVLAVMKLQYVAHAVACIRMAHGEVADTNILAVDEHHDCSIARIDL
jgi:hypothetical protein